MLFRIFLIKDFKLKLESIGSVHRHVSKENGVIS